MRIGKYLHKLVIGIFVSVLLTGLLVVAAVAQSTTPVIIIPGLTGSELINKKTKEVVWFKARRSKVDDLRLPVSIYLTRNRDDLIPGDILRSVKLGILPRVDIYEGLVNSFITQNGFHEESWEAPTADGDKKSIYVLAYDWRLDNVENARLLIRKIEQLKAKLKRPNLKFNVVAHSMGGLITRYAAMYGDADLPASGRKPAPNWAGARHFGRIVLLGTPNEGSALSLSSLINGFSIVGININLPFVQNISRFDLFSIPSGYQLLPAPGTLQAVDENFDPVNIDLYDPKVWTKYGWNAIDDKGFPGKFNSAERRSAPAFFKAMLDRARNFHSALAANPPINGGVNIELVGAECKDSLDTILVYQEAKTRKWKTLFKPDGFTKFAGDKVTDTELKSVMMAPGDGVVTARSLESVTLSKLAGTPSLLRSTNKKFICEEHSKLGANAEVQSYILGLFNGK